MDCSNRPVAVSTSHSDVTTGILPARLGYARDQTLRGQLAKGETRQLEAADERAATARHFATIYNPRRAGVARQLRQAGVIFLRFQLGADGSVFFHRCALTLVAINPGGFGHKKRLNLLL